MHSVIERKARLEDTLRKYKFLQEVYASADWSIESESAYLVLVLDTNTYDYLPLFYSLMDIYYFSAVIRVVSTNDHWALENTKLIWKAGDWVR